MNKQALGGPQLLQKLVDEQHPLRLANTYKGISVSFEAKILSFDGSLAVLSVALPQAVCLVVEKMTNLISDALPCALRATVVDVNLKLGQAALVGFMPVSNTVGLRQETRVAPADVVPLILSSEHIMAKAKLLDISTGGVGLQLKDNLYRAEVMSVGMGVRLLQIDLPVTRTLGWCEIASLGTIRNIQYWPTLHSYRLGVQIKPNPQVRALIEAYIARRQKEILTEITTLGQLLKKTSDTKEAE
ncbi:MAG TPA: PilZ domain-containing protein [Anaerolineaceae bacterium]|nr:PilZ domain-containing protein [Anaerolineaceae bacterium]HPN53405.1 PilZ domain-containing protein [Anaerolineaceae bacterium]